MRNTEFDPIDLRPETEPQPESGDKTVRAVSDDKTEAKND